MYTTGQYSAVMHKLALLFTTSLLLSAFNIRPEVFRPFVLRDTQGNPLDSETGWTGELWSKSNLLKGTVTPQSFNLYYDDKWCVY